MCVRVETGSGHPGLTRFIKYPGLTRILHWITCDINASGGDELSVPEGDDVTISPQDISRRVTAGEYILKKKKNAKGSRAWEQ